MADPRCRHGFLLSAVPCEYGCSGIPLSPVTKRGTAELATRAARERRRRQARIGEGQRKAPRNPEAADG